MADPKPAATSSGENEGVNVQVLLRCRPMSDKEIAERTPQVISCNEVLREVTLYQNVGGKQMSRTFRFDKVFSSDAAQEKLYKQAIVPIVQEVMEGFNCTIFAYGQTGTGKTYTMEGGPRRSDDGKSLSAEAGVIPRSIKQIFDTIEANNTDSTVKVTFLELYNEELTDLLSFDDPKDESKRLRLLEDRSGVVVQGLEEVSVKSTAEIYQVLDRGTAKRRTAETLLNKRSSRSHSVFSITIHMREVTPEGEDVVKVGKLNLVDLAGSENISRSGAKDGRAREAGSINQSLLTLGRVITALVEHSGHVPYRDSKLTRLLRESLGGKTKTCIIATIAPTVQCQEETISTLDYAHRAKNIRNRPEVNQKISKTAMIKEMSSEMEKLRMELISQREKNGVFLPTEKYQADELERVQLRDTVKALREEMKAEQEYFSTTLEQQKAVSERTISKLQSELASTREDLEDVTNKLLDANRTIHERQYIVEAQRRAEQEMADAAEGLRGELAAAARDIEGLFASMEELAGVHAGDRDTMARLQQHVKARLSDLGSSLTGALGSQRQQLSAMRDTLAAFQSSKQQDLQAMVAKVDGVRSSVAAMEQRMEQLQASTSTALGSMGATAQAYSSDAIAAAAALEAATRNAVESLSRSLEEQAEQLRAFAAQQAAASEECMGSLRGALQRMSSGFSSLKQSTEQARAQAEQQAGALNQGLGSFVVRHKERGVQQQGALLSQIMAAVQAFVQERNTEVEQEVLGLQQQAARGDEELRSQLDRIAQAAASEAEGVPEAEASTTEVLRARQQTAEQHAAALGSSLQSCREQALCVHRGVAGGLQAAASSAQDLSKRMAAVSEQGVAGVREALQACSSEAASLADAVQQDGEELVQAMQRGAAADGSTADSLAALCSAGMAALDELSGRQTGSMGGLASDVEGALQQRLGVQRQVPPPPPRGVQVPPASAIRDLRCPAEDKLLAKCHSEFPHLFTASPSSPRPSTSGGSAGGKALGLATSGLENVTPMAVDPPSAVQLPPYGGPGSVPPSPRSTTGTGLRSRIPSKPSLLVPSSPASVKDMSANVTSRQLLADKTNKGGSILSDWAA